MQQINNDSLQKRLYQHAFMDGVSELAIGVWLAGLGLYYFLDRIFDTNFFYIYLVLMSLLPVLLGPATRFVKQRITAPRIGYVRFPKQRTQAQRKRKAISGGIAGLVLGALIGFVVAVNQSPDAGLMGLLNWVPLFMGTVFAAAFIYSGIRYEIRRFYVVSALIFAAAVATVVLNPGPVEGIVIFSALAGALLIASGGSTMFLFVRRYPVVKDADMGVAQDDGDEAP
ncbi:MAG: hypothetical protein R2873_17410 [Caldilineaceae bacterium]|nr:hypothetical protein [Caldilineaceae bacterium]